MTLIKLSIFYAQVFAVMIRTDMHDWIRLTLWKRMWREQYNGWLE